MPVTPTLPSLGKVGHWKRMSAGDRGGQDGVSRESSQHVNGRTQTFPCGRPLTCARSYFFCSRSAPCPSACCCSPCRSDCLYMHSNVTRAKDHASPHRFRAFHGVLRRAANAAAVTRQLFRLRPRTLASDTSPIRAPSVSGRGCSTRASDRAHRAHPGRDPRSPRVRHPRSAAPGHRV